MKNKLILSFLIIPIIIACQNNNVNVSSSPEPSKSNIISSVSPTNTISPTVMPTTNVVLSSPSPPLLFVDKDATPIIESNMQPVFTYPYSPPLTESFTYPNGSVEKRNISTLYGKIFDENDNTINGATINVSNTIHPNELIYYHVSLNSISKEDGSFNIKTYENLLLNISVEKEGYTKRYTSQFHDMGGYGYEWSFYREKSLQRNKIYITNTPEIQSIKINKNIINKYNVITISDYISNNIKIPKFKMKSIDFLEIDLSFNNSMIRDTLEKNITIESLDKKNIYDKNIEKATFKWSNKDKNVIFNVPISKSQEDIKYRLYFKEPFVDIYNHKPYKDEYISLQNDIRDGNLAEISKNIVFEIEKSK